MRYVRKPTDIQRKDQLTPLVIHEEKNLGNSRVNRLCTGVGCFRNGFHKWDMTPSGLVREAQKNRPSTMLSSNVQSIDFPVGCMAWRFWMMGQSTGCSTPAPRFSAAKQWIERSVSYDEDVVQSLMFLYSKLVFKSLTIILPSKATLF